jgi:aminopeptidase N
MAPMKRLLLLTTVGIMLLGCGDPGDQPEAAIATIHNGQSADPIGVVNEVADAALALPRIPPAARLPRGIAPSHYWIHLEIDPRLPRFSGSSRIEVELAASTTFLWLHGIDLEVSSATAVLAGGEIITLDWEQMAPTGIAKLSSATPLPAGKISLQFEYTAPFSTNLEGLYKVEQGADSYVFTQFEATSARLAFPAFDEPGFKVPFDISMTIPAQYIGITNSPQRSEVMRADGNKTLTFATTRPLPTYLIAVAVGPFDLVEWQPIPATKLRAQPLPLRGITTRGKSEQISFALDNTAAILIALEDYFDIAYPFAKLDIIAVPDFSAGAMENAGAITYREQAILLDADSPVSQKRSFFVTHAHELAHQWFGNLVTPDWWEDIWLNESFATWNSHIILDQLFPSENYREAMQNSASRVMRNDSLASARQIREPIERHQDIGSAFNGITYAKGGGVLSMFESFLGREQFRDGIRHYMKTFAFGNTTADDFIGAIADANPQVDGNRLRAAFASYIEQPGLPVVSSSLRCDATGARIELSQQRYLPAGSQGSTDQTWIIPACISTIDEGQRSSGCLLMQEKEQTLHLDTQNCPAAILPNTDGSGYYRWSLPADQWQPLLAAFEQLSVNEQISVANSLSAALNNGSMSLRDFIATVPTLTKSSSWRVAMAPREDIYKIMDFLANDQERLQIEATLRQWYRPQLDRLNGIQRREQDEDQFRSKLMNTLALGANDPVIGAELAAAGAAFTGFEGDEKIHMGAVDPDLQLIALLVAVEEYGKPYADLLWRHFLESDNALLKQYLLIAMAYSADAEVARLMRDRILSPELRDNEIFSIFGSQMSREENRQDMWDWARDNMAAVLERIPAWRKGQIPAQFDGFCTREQAGNIEDFFTPIIDTLESGPRYLANSLETIRLCSAFVDLHTAAE